MMSEGYMPQSADIEIRLLLEAIYLRFHYDFRSYSMASLKRRLEVALPKLGCETISGLQEKLLHEPAAFPELLQYLTVQVSDMFRDPSFFRALRERIVPVLQTYPSLKVWVAGCSTGEEVYSLSILLREEGLLDRTILYATDINRTPSEGPRRASSRSTASRRSRKTTGSPAPGAPSRSTTPRPTGRPSSIARSASGSCSRITASPRTACSRRSSSSRAATC